MILLILQLAISLSALGLALTALIFGLRAYIKIEAMEKSTHQIQYVPAPTIEELQSLKKSDEALVDSYADIEDLPQEDEE